MAHGPPLSAEEKARILELRRENVSGREIALRMGRSVNLVAVFLRNPTAYGKTIRKPRGKDPELDDNLRSLILAGWTTKKTVPQIKASLPVPLSQRTVKNFLKSHIETAQLVGGDTDSAAEQSDNEGSVSRKQPRPTATSQASREVQNTAAVGETVQGTSMITRVSSPRESSSFGLQHNERPRQSTIPRVRDISVPVATTASPAPAHSDKSHPHTIVAAPATSAISRPIESHSRIVAATHPIPATAALDERHIRTEVVELLDRKLDALTDLLTSQNTMFSQLVNGQNALIGQLVVVQNTMAQMLQLQQQQQQQQSQSKSSAASNGNGERRQ